jgi:SP family general alpha glucoside:H+ symporter-like MFS transporter
MSSGYLLDRWGPQKIVIIASILFICPVMIQTFANSRVMMLVGKLLGGIPQGIFNVAASNFVSEASNLRMRGPLSALLPLSAIGGVALGLTIGYERIAYVTSGMFSHITGLSQHVSEAVLTFCSYTDWLSWRLALIMQVVPPIICIATLPFATTSPIFLVKKGRMEDARQSLRKLYGTTADIPARLAIIQQAVAIEREEAAKIGASSYKDLFSTAIARKRTFASAWLWFTYQANGQVFIASGLYFLIITGESRRRPLCLITRSNIFVTA